eukprot:TRINITY_DN7697_c0_g1_i1.p1 TRINITY_DN7697_c0_g1~~TRINITY_DN7697_c0_g1_i1.p1  ORF type:complete len:195 (+),score=52.32 TRINITY_DN7697_c0_g1_i1:82-666(+)
MSKENLDKTFKILLLGDSGIGKTCLLLRFSDDTYNESQTSTISDFKIRKMDDVEFQLWDTAGQQQLKGLTENHFKKALGALVCFDLTDRSSFNSCKGWIEMMNKNKSQKISWTLVGLKSDLQSKREISVEEAREFASWYGKEYFEASSKTSSNVGEIFQSLSKQIQEYVKKTPNQTQEEKNKKKKKLKKKCTIF